MKMRWFVDACRSARAHAGRVFERVIRTVWAPIVARARNYYSDREHRLTLIKHSVMIPSLVFILLLIHEKVFSFMSRQDVYVVDYKNLHRAAVPGWLRGSLVRADQILLELPSHDSLMSPDVVMKVSRSLEQYGWVERVVSVERIFPDRLRITMDYRTPLVAIAWRGKYYFMDHTQTRLPGIYANIPALPSKVYTVTGIRSSPPAPGKVWADEDARAACDMARLMDRYQAGEKYGVVEIDISNMDGRLDRKKGEVVLKTAKGVEIFWGNAPVSKRFGGISPDERFRNLEKAFQKYPGFKGLKYVKVYAFGRAVVREESNLANR